MRCLFQFLFLHDGSMFSVFLSSFQDSLKISSSSLYALEIPHGNFVRERRPLLSKILKFFLPHRRAAPQST